MSTGVDIIILMIKSFVETVRETSTRVDITL